jgi:hypothetical protein
MYVRQPGWFAPCGSGSLRQNGPLRQNGSLGTVAASLGAISLTERSTGSSKGVEQGIKPCRARKAAEAVLSEERDWCWRSARAFQAAYQPPGNGINGHANSLSLAELFEAAKLWKVRSPMGASSWLEGIAIP